MRILLTEDDELIIKSLAKALTDQHYTVDVATDGQVGWELLESFTYDLILLDVGLPKLDGISLCRRLRSQGNQTPILLLTARDSSTSRVMGLDAGADDYVAKPFDLQELLARIRALLRRGGAALPPLLEWRNLQLDPSTCEVACNGQPLHLTPKEYGLLELFLRNSHRIFSCSALIDHLWSFEEPPTEETVRSHVKGLRQKLKAAAVADDPLETVYGIGYRLKPAELEGRVEEERAKVRPLKSKIVEQVGGEAAYVWGRAKESFNRRVAVVERAVTLLLQDQLSEDLRQQAEQEAHKLAGSLGMYGSDEGSRLAQAIEPLFAPGSELDQQQIQRLTQLVVGLRRELQSLDDGASAPPAPQPVTVPTDERPSLLIVQADQDLAAALAAEATNWGMRSQIVTHAAAARKQLLRQRPDALLLDLPVVQDSQGNAVPEPAALSLLAELNRYAPPLPAIVFTEQKQLIDRIRITSLGGRRVLQRPVSPAQALEAVSQVLEHLRTTEARVMVVDDDPQVLMALHALLDPWGIKVFTLDDPLRFLEVLAIASPNLLVLDVELPHVRGIELCQLVRNDPQWSGLPVLFLTAHADAETMHRVFAAGADDYVSKPIVGPELVTRILNRLERSRLLQNFIDLDALTGVATYRKSAQELSQQLQWSDLHQQPFCLAIFNLDQLKAINQQYGHAAGDQVLFRLGKLLRQTFQSEQIVGRWGGAEFVIGMVGMTKRDAAKRLLEVLNNLRQIEFIAVKGAPFRVTGSAAVVQAPQDGADLPNLYQAAEALLSQVEAAGGDRVMCK
ncbi:MAG TPA: response regulator [Coleofasciculaceae cyanobacterium]